MVEIRATVHLCHANSSSALERIWVVFTNETFKSWAAKKALQINATNVTAQKKKATTSISETF